MKNLGQTQGRGNAEAGGDAVQTFRPVDGRILTRVNQIESRDPHSDRSPEQPGDRAGQISGHSGPRARGGSAIHNPQPDVAKPGEALGVGVAYQPHHSQRGQQEDKRIEHPGRKQHDSQGNQARSPHAAPADLPRLDGAVGGAGIAGVDLRIDGPIEGHGRGAGRRHGHRNPHELPEQRVPGDGRGQHPALLPGQRHADVGERQRKNRVLEFDHFEEHAQFIHPNTLQSK